LQTQISELVSSKIAAHASISGNAMQQLSMLGKKAEIHRISPAAAAATVCTMGGWLAMLVGTPKMDFAVE
jgi:hypothetical protein